MVKLLCHKTLEIPAIHATYTAGHYYEMEVSKFGDSYEDSNGCMFTIEPDEDGLSYKNWFTTDLEFIAEETVTISKAEYDELLAEVEFLNCLRACGVDNWEGYSDAGQMMEEEE